MNIVIVDCFDTWEDRVELLYKAFTGSNHNVKVLMSDYKHIDKIKRNDIKRDYRFFHAVPYKRNMSINRMYSHIRLSRVIFKCVEKNARKIDLIWVFAPPNIFISDVAKVKKNNPNIKVIIDLIDLWPETMPIGKVKKMLSPWGKLRNDNLKYADVIVAECNLYRDVLKEEIEGKVVETLYLARKDLGYKPELNLTKNGLSFCYLGSINNIIDIDSIVRMICYCQKNNDTTVHIIGDGERKNELIKRLKDTGANVIYHGKVYDRTKKQEILDSCHFGLNIMKESVCVGLTMKSIDYFEFGVPIINNIRGDIWDIVDEFECGINISNDTLLNDIQRISSYQNKYRINSRSFFDKELSEEVFDNKALEIIDMVESKPKKNNVKIRSSNYGAIETIKNVAMVILGKVKYPGARLIRLPIVIRGKEYISFGKGLTTGYNCRIEVNGKHKNKALVFGENVNIGDYVSVRCAESISIGNDVLIGSRVLIIDNSHGNYRGTTQDSPDVPPNKRSIYTAPIVIGDNVWIGEGAVIQAGVTIGNGSVVAANSVVTSDVEACTIVGGVPSKVLKKWNQKSGKWEK